MATVQPADGTTCRIGFAPGRSPPAFKGLFTSAGRDSSPVMVMLLIPIALCLAYRQHPAAVEFGCGVLAVMLRL